jgi:hypothetical protein
MKTVFEAFDHLIKGWDERMPSDLFEAKQSRAGKRAYQLSEARAKKMLEKYGGGAYHIKIVVEPVNAAVSE